MDTDTELQFLQRLKEQHLENAILVVIGNTPCHRPKILQKIDGLFLVFLPPYSPELNLNERFFEEMRKHTANLIFNTLESIETAIDLGIQKYYDKNELKKLVGYGWIMEQWNEVMFGEVNQGVLVNAK